VPNGSRRFTGFELRYSGLIIAHDGISRDL
jgi:hypothetical protein